ncbi:heme-binding protein 2 [Polymixia lowei]
MIIIAGLVGFLLVLTTEARVGSSSELDFCSETEECLLYKLVCKNEDYEVRHYDSVKWVSTNEESLFMEKATTTAFRRLYRYITGSNEDDAKIDMTAPVIIKKQRKGMWQSNVYTLSFLLPSKYQMNPPKPTDDQVFFSDTQDMNVYVRSYGGWMMSWMAWWQAHQLSKQLDAAGANYNQDYHYDVGYNSPMTFLNRHNEVWCVVEGEPVCPGTPTSS